MYHNHKNIFTPQNLHNIVDEVMNTSFGDLIGSQMTSKLPAVNISENETAYAVEVVAPGLAKSDFEVTVSDNKLHISVAKQIVQSDETPKSVKKEWDYSNFKRSFKLSPKVDISSINAAYNLGILTITLPKKSVEEVEEKMTIDIQ